MLTHTYTKTYEPVLYADPYKVCNQCGSWIDGALDIPDAPLIVVPCDHERGYRDVCPSWGPVDGCRCEPKGHGRQHIPDGKVA